MRPVAVLLVALALAIAGLTAYLAKSWMDGQSEAVKAAQKAAQPAQATRMVLVAAHDLGAGAILADGDLRYQPWPENAVDSRMIVQNGGDDPKGNFVGAVLRRPVMTGEPLTASAAFRQDEAGVMAGMLAPGMRALSVAVSATTSASGFILPGDRVDVVLTAHFKANQNGAALAGPGAAVQVASETVLRDVRVIAIDAATAPPPKSGAAVQGKTATLEVSPKDVEKLLTASEMGQLALVLRSLVSGEGEAQGFTTDIEASPMIGNLRGGGSAVPADSGIVPENADLARGHAVKVNRAGVTSNKVF